MEIRIRNVRSVIEADLRLDNVTIIAGRNESGKSSVTTAVAACLSGEWQIPEYGVLLKKDAVLVVKDGANPAVAVIRVGDDENYSAVSWPDCEVASQGAAPRGHPVAVGHLKLMKLPVTERRAILSELFDAAVTEKELFAAFAAVELNNDGARNAIWNLIHEQGWEVAHKKLQEQGAKLKGAWAEITGENYGSKKAARWVPEGFEPTDSTNIPQLTSRAEAAQVKRDAAAGKLALTEERQTELSATAGLVGKLREDKVALKTARDGIAAQLVEHREALVGLPTISDGAGMPCPHCGKPIVVNTATPGTYRLMAKDAGGMTEDEKKVARNERASTMGEISKLEGEERALDNQILTTGRAVSAGEDAQKILDDSTGRDGDPEELEKVVAQLARANQRLAAAQSIENAGKRHKSITANQKAIDVLAPGGGVRQEKLADKIVGFNESIALACEKAGFSHMEMTPDLELFYDDPNGRRPYLCCSESAQMRIDTAILMALAHEDHTNIICFDRLDMIVKDQRPGFIKVVAGLGIDAVIGMTAPDKDSVRGLAAGMEKGKLGRIYWISDGYVERVEP